MLSDSQDFQMNVHFTILGVIWKESNKKSRCTLCWRFHRLSGFSLVFLQLIYHIVSTQQYEKQYILFFHYSDTKYKHRTQQLVHLLHTIGSPKIFGHFKFQQTAAFFYEKGMWIKTETNTRKTQAYLSAKMLKRVKK